MSVSLSVAPPYGWPGQLAYRWLEWLDTGLSTSFATNQAFANLCANIERHAASVSHSAVKHLFTRGYLGAWRVRRFASQWAAIEECFKEMPVTELVCVIEEGEAFEGKVLERDHNALIVSFSPSELQRFVSETDHAAKTIWHLEQFHTESVRDAFFLQFTSAFPIVTEALNVRRGLLLE